MTPWWAREITCPTCGAEPGETCGPLPCGDRVKAALTSLELRVGALRTELRKEERLPQVPAWFVAQLPPDRRLAALDRLDQAIAAARDLLAYVGSDDAD